jgi:hypothetical protein
VAARSEGAGGAGGAGGRVETDASSHVNIMGKVINEVEGRSFWSGAKGTRFPVNFTGILSQLFVEC